MLLDQNPLRQAVDGIVVEDGHRRLQNDWAGIEAAVYKMHGRARHSNTVLEGLPLSM